MATISSLRDSLKSRLGLATLTTAESSRIDECLNGAVARVFSDGLPGLTESYVGSVQGDLSTTISAHVAGTATVTLVSTSGVFPRDILTVGATQYLIRAVNGSDVDLGVPVTSGLTGTVTVTRRALELPHEGQVVGVGVVDGRSEVLPLIDADQRAPFETAAEPSHFAQFWSADQDKSYLSMYPAPNTNTQIIVRQVRANAEDADIDAPYSMLEPVLTMAMRLYLTFSSALDMAGLVLQDQRQVADLKHQAHDRSVRSR